MIGPVLKLNDIPSGEDVQTYCNSQKWILSRNAQDPLFSSQKSSQGLGQLEAYLGAVEGVTFQMDNGLIWDAIGVPSDKAIQGVHVKKATSKFFVVKLDSGKVILNNETGMCLAPIPSELNPNTTPLRLVHFPEDPVCQYEVFYRANKVAFLAYNGLFLSRVFREFHTIEAVNAVDVDSCYFRPLIGDIKLPTFEILDVTSNVRSAVTCLPYELLTRRFTNRNNTQKYHTFSLTWKKIVTDRISWKYVWGLGLANSHKFKINGMQITLKYTKDNDKTIYVKRNINETRRKKVVVPPKSTCTANLIVVKRDNAAFKFRATIRKVKPNGEVEIMSQPGAFAGLVYNEISLVTEIEPLSVSTRTHTYLRRLMLG